MLQQLVVMSLRNNKLARLPSEIGNCSSLTVLDLTCNHLDNLPTSLTKLQLRALWLAENQSKPLPCLQTDTEGGTGCSVITCCLLPQDRDVEEENWVGETTKLLNIKFNQLQVQDS